MSESGTLFFFTYICAYVRQNVFLSACETVTDKLLLSRFWRIRALAGLTCCYTQWEEWMRRAWALVIVWLAYRNPSLTCHLFKIVTSPWIGCHTLRKPIITWKSKHSRQAQTCVACMRRKKKYSLHKQRLLGTETVYQWPWCDVNTGFQVVHEGILFFSIWWQCFSSRNQRKPVIWFWQFCRK